MVYAFGGISGCHINPAITVSMLIVRKISIKDAALYIVFQCIGAIIGAGILYSIAIGIPSYSLLSFIGLGQNGYGIASPAGYNLTSALIAEIVLTFIFVLVVHGSTHERVPKGFAGLIHRLDAGAYPHRLYTDHWNISESRKKFGTSSVRRRNSTGVNLWLFIVAPIIGGILAALVWKILK